MHTKLWEFKTGMPADSYLQEISNREKVANPLKTHLGEILWVGFSNLENPTHWKIPMLASGVVCPSLPLRHKY